MTYQLEYTLLLLIIMSIVLVKEWLETEIVIFSTLILLMIGDVISVKEAFSGCSNEGMLTIGLLFVVAGALQTTGALSIFSNFLFGKSQTSITKKLLRILFPISSISAFLNNTPVVAILIPAVHQWTEKNNYAISKFLIPISYAAILGGMCTLIGTCTNLIVHGLLIENGQQGFGFFEISKITVPAAIVGLIYIVFFGHRFLPERKQPIVELGENTREFVVELKVTSEYENIGKTIEQAGLRHLKGLFLFQIERLGKIKSTARPGDEIKQDDRLFFTGLPKTILELQKTPGLQLKKDSSFDLKQYDSDEIKPYEAVISQSSPLVGENVRDSNFHEKYGAVIIAIHRNGFRLKKKIGDIILHSGDTLLILAESSFRKKWYYSNDFYLVSPAEEVSSKPKRKSYIAIGTFVTMILLVIFKILPLITAAALAAITLITTRCITPADAKRIVDWRILIIISSAFGIAAGIMNSGLADKVASFINYICETHGIVIGLFVLYLITSLYNTIITSSATVAFAFPIALATANSLGIDVKPFAITVTIAAAASFATPISYQTNLMIYGPGGYKFKDFLKVGIPLQLLIGIVAGGLIYFFYF